MAKRLPKIKTGTAVIIHWFDAHTDSSRSGSPKELMDTKCELMDIGFYIGAKGKFVTIAVEVDRDNPNQFRHTHHIPKVNIIEIEVLSDNRGIQKTTNDAGKSNNVPDKGCEGTE